MSFEHDYSGVEIYDFSPAPAGQYALVITDMKEQLSKNGDRQVVVTAQIESGPHKGKRITHWVTFMDKGAAGAGMSAHFLKTIGQPWEQGKVTVNPEDWIGCRFNGVVVVDEYNGKTNNKIKEMSPITIGAQCDMAVQAAWLKKYTDPKAGTSADTSVPF